MIEEGRFATRGIVYATGSEDELKELEKFDEAAFDNSSKASPPSAHGNDAHYYEGILSWLLASPIFFFLVSLMRKGYK